METKAEPFSINFQWLIKGRNRLSYSHRLQFTPAVTHRIPAILQFCHAMTSRKDGLQVVGSDFELCGVTVQPWEAGCVETAEIERWKSRLQKQNLQRKAYHPYTVSAEV